MRIQFLQIFSAVIMLFLTNPQGLVKAQSQSNVIRGRIINTNTRIPVPDATIYIEGTGSYSASDQNGIFEIEGYPDDEFRLIVSCIGYKAAEKDIDPSRDNLNSIELRLTEDLKEIGQVSIVKNKRELEILSTPTLEPLSIGLSTTTISSDDIRKTASKTVIEAMAYAPGAFIETRGRKVKQFFSVRGQKYPYPEYSINGVWQREFHETPYFFSSGNVEKIEIIRSSAALLHGLSGIAGMVNIVTRKYTKPETSVELEYGSFNSLHSFVSHSGKKESLNYSLNLGYDKTNGLPGRHAGEKMLNAYGTLEWNPSDNISITTNIFHMNGMRQFMQAEYPASINLIQRLESYDPFISNSVSLKASVRQNVKSSLEISSFYTSRKPEFINELTGETVTEYDSEIGVNIIETILLGESNILRFGGLYNHWDAPNGKRFYVGRKSDLHTVSGVITDEHMFGKLNLNGGVRWVKTYINEFGAFSIDGSGSAFTQVAPIMDEWQPVTLQMTGGSVYDLNAHSLISMNIVSGSVKPREGAMDDNYENLKNEYRTMVDLGYKLSGTHLSDLVITGFYVNQKNAIIYSGEILELEDGRFVELYENQDQFQYGIELEAKSSWVFNRSTRVFLNLTGMRSMIWKENEAVENLELPGLIGNTGVNIRLFHIDMSLYGNYSSEFFSTRFADKSAGPVPLGGYFRIDLNLGYSFGPGENWRVYGLVKNLTDVNYSTVAGYPDPGRRFHAGIEFRFSECKKRTY